MISALANGASAASPAFQSVPSGGTDLIALWKKALDAAHVVSGEETVMPDDVAHDEARDDAVLSAAARTDPKGADAALRDGVARACSDAASDLAPDSDSEPVEATVQAVQSRAAAGASGVIARAVGIEVGRANRVAAVPPEPPVPSTPVVTPAMPAGRLLVPSRVGTPFDKPEAPPAAVADPLPLPEEAVHVFLGDRGLEVVVRHIGMAPQAAVWCALETARQLTGDRKSLHHVLLNGSTVYQDGKSLCASPPEGIVHFTC